MIIKLFGIFKIDSLKNTPEYEYLYNKLITEKKLEDVSGGRNKSFILVSEKKDKLKGYISNIGTRTMRKREIM